MAEHRITRSAARQAALLLLDVQAVKPEPSKEPSNPENTRRKTSRRQALTDDSREGEVIPLDNRKRKRAACTAALIVGDELPHNLGKIEVPPKLDVHGFNAIKREKKIDIDMLADELQHTADKATTKTTLTLDESTLNKRKTAKKNPYGLTPGISPFPHWSHPTAEECAEVNRLLSSVHGEINPPATIPEPSLTVTGCGEVPSVLDALIRTLLSGATTGKNSAMAFNGLVQRFGILTEGVGKGSVNWDAVRRAPIQEVYEAMKSGGLADIKSKSLKAILDMVYRENQDRKDALQHEQQPTSLSGTKDKDYDIACAEQHVLSLNHYYHLSNEQAMTELVKYPGIGPKTAACVLLFCLQRPCFAVDTHIFRICKWLGWVPTDRATEITAFSHLEVRIPNHLKYSLHQLFIRHGKTCPRCRAITGQSAAGWEDGCVIDHLVKRTGKRKG